MTTKFQPLQGKKPLSFRRLMALKQTGNDTFESLVAAWPPAHHTKAFGGHVFAQAMYAASKTVEQGLVAHQMTGYFILPGAVDVPFIYRVRRVRDGGVYCLRSVDVFQGSQEAAQGAPPCFTGTVSFKRTESGNAKWRPFGHQSIPPDHVETTYRTVLDGLKPEDHPLAPGADALWWEEEEAERWGPTSVAFPGVETRKVDMAKYNGEVEAGGGKDGEGATRWRQLLFYRLILGDEGNEPVGQVVEDLNLDAAAHLYASDKNSLFLVPRALGYERVQANMSSLSHTVVLHGLASHLRMVDEQGQSKWFVQESWTSQSGENRGCHNSLLWDYESGRLLGTTLQDGMVKFPSDLVGQRSKGLAEKQESKL